MYILGLAGRPDTFTCKADEKSFLKAIKVTLDKKYQEASGTPFFFVKIDAERIWTVGVRGKQDTFCAYTTELEAKEKANKFATYYGSREVYLISFGDENNDR